MVVGIFVMEIVWQMGGKNNQSRSSIQRNNADDQ